MSEEATRDRVQVGALKVTRTIKSPRAGAGEIELKGTCQFKTVLGELLVVQIGLISFFSRFQSVCHLEFDLYDHFC